MAEQIPESIGKYKIMGLIAKGGMGAVYKSVHPSLKRPVILKKLTVRSNPIVRERFKREAQILLELQNPYIVHLFDYFIEGSSHYIVEEFVDGMSLADLIEKQVSLGTEISLLVFLDACYALKYAHAKGIVHRDIKPGNILISRRAEVKLADFGIASNETGDDLKSESAKKSGKVTMEANLTQSGTTLGTPAYMPPEQITDSSSVDKRADIYAMGVMLYEMLTGSKPFPSSFSASTMEKIKKGKYVNPRKIDKKIPRVICRMIHKMLKANPNKRYQSIDRIISIVKQYLSSYDTHAIRVALAQCIISKKQFVIPAFEKKRSFGKMIFGSLVVALALGIGFQYCWKMGYVHETILRKWYTPVKLSLTLPVGESVGNDLLISSFVFEDDGDKIPELEEYRRNFNFDALESSDGKIKKFSTEKMYLKPGKYRIKITFGPYVWWQNLNVEKEELNLKFDGPSQQDHIRDLKVKVNAFDAVSNEKIENAQYMILDYNKNKWVPLASLEKYLKNGNVWKIKVDAQGYQESMFSLMIDWYQDDLVINAYLYKE